jgi:DNA polymerase sigma
LTNPVPPFFLNHTARQLNNVAACSNKSSLKREFDRFADDLLRQKMSEILNSAFILDVMGEIIRELGRSE